MRNLLGELDERSSQIRFEVIDFSAGELIRLQHDKEILRRVYRGLCLECTEIDRLKTSIDQIVSVRNEAAHHGVLPSVAATYMEQHLRENVGV